MKPISSILLAGIPVGLVLLAPLRAEPRTFTDLQGRKIEAEITAVAGSTVTLRLADGRISKVPVDRLSEGDRLFISIWKDRAAKETPAESKPSPMPADFKAVIDIEAEKERLGKGRKEESNTGEVVAEDWIYEVSLRNRSRAAVEGLEISYRIYVDPQASAKMSAEDPPKFHGHRAKVDPMADGASLVVKTEKVVIHELELSPDFAFTDGSRNRLEDDLEGIWIKLWLGDRKVGEFKTNNSTVKKAQWPDEEPAEGPPAQGAAGP